MFLLPALPRGLVPAGLHFGRRRYLGLLTRNPDLSRIHQLRLLGNLLNKQHHRHQFPFGNKEVNPPTISVDRARKGRKEVLTSPPAARPLEVEPLLNRPEMYPVGGRLSLYRERWTFSAWAHSIVKSGLGWKWVNSPPSLKMFYQEPTPILLEYVQKMLEKRVIEPCHSLKFQGRLFYVPKKDSNERRVILDLSPFNIHIECQSFKMTTIRHVRNSLPKGAWTCSIDLTDAYWHVPIAKNFRPYLGFSLGRKAYRFRAMPFGLNIAPRTFTKLVNVIVSVLRTRGVLMVAYLDDWLIWADNKQSCIDSTKIVLDLVANLGFHVNLKSHD